jgi:uncharacterized phage protein (TIGR01671 family)
MLGFRVWDSKSARFMNFTDLVYIDYNGLLNIFNPLSRDYEVADEEDLKRYIPMQSTGIKDSTGTEIYEGDIIEYSTYNILGQVYTEYWEVEELPGSFNHLSNLDFEYEIKVARNIYENPKLLEKV